VRIVGLTPELHEHDMVKRANTWELQVALKPGIYLFFFEVDGYCKHNPNLSSVKSKYLSDCNYNVICIGEGFSVQMAEQLCATVDLLVEKDSCIEIENYLFKFPRAIDLVFFGGRSFFGFVCTFLCHDF